MSRYSDQPENERWSQEHLQKKQYKYIYIYIQKYIHTDRQHGFRQTNKAGHDTKHTPRT